ncbi:hypothetical protein FGO68_gene13219 [Halteria grandinella]|uniref:Uncharacterized protein n=1 Tax=Halteria grandinella TaxID=5974 RepID=A0A8J8NC12_HALGN|nr:hypothetical protein FGO68_gene13219 [Halteria grandinella]
MRTITKLKVNKSAVNFKICPYGKVRMKAKSQRTHFRVLRSCLFRHQSKRLINNSFPLKTIAISPLRWICRSKISEGVSQYFRVASSNLVEPKAIIKIIITATILGWQMVRAQSSVTKIQSPISGIRCRYCTLN